MKALIVGAGRMGTAAAFDLLHDEAVEEVGLVGCDAAKLRCAQDRLGKERLRIYPLGSEAPDLAEVMAGYDVGVLALPDRRSSYAAVGAAIVAGLDIVDMLEEYHRHPDKSEIEGLTVPAGMTLEAYGEDLHCRARARGVTLLDGMGFAPGVSNIAVGHALRSLDRAVSATVRVGGIPSKEAAARHPLGYLATWSFQHVLREYMVKVLVRRGGSLVEVEARSGRESFHFRDGPHDELLECAVTPGMPSLVFTRPELPNFCEKTIRWPGHYQSIDLLESCGLLSLDPIQTAAGPRVPRTMFADIVEPRLRPRPGDTDVCVMWNTITGERDGCPVCIEQSLWTEADVAHGFSAMARVTGFTAAIGARFLAAERIVGGPGIVAPEDGVTGDTCRAFFADLARRGIAMHETTRSLA